MSDEVLAEDMVQLDLNNLLAAILTNIPTVAIPFKDVVANYDGKSISLEYDDETNMVLLSLVETPEEENQDELG